MEYLVFFPFLDKVPVNIKRFLIAILFVLASQVFAKEKNTVLLISQNSTQDSKLSSSEQLYANSALQTIIGNLTLVDGITIRMDANDVVLRQIQKKNHIEAEKGLMALDAIYAIDAGAKADVYIAFSLTKYPSGWMLSYKASDIETLEILFSGKTDIFPLEQLEEAADRLSFSVLDNLSKHNFISPVPFSIKAQLLHEADTEENFRQYIAEYDTRALSLQKELDALQKENLSAEERIKNESAERALLLKIEMMQRKKSVLETAEKNRQAETAQLQKRQTEIRALTESQRRTFEQNLSALESKRTEILKESARSLPLKKRIELIEADRENLMALKKQIARTVIESNAHYDGEKKKELDAKNGEPWRKADLSDGKPSEAAKQFRRTELAEITRKWDERKLAAEKEIRTGVQTMLDSYEKAFSRALSDLEATEFTFTSISRGENYVQLKIDDYDAEKESWSVHTATDFSAIPLLSVPYQVLPDIQIRYDDMTGKKIPVGSDVAAYNAYRDNVEWADLYFRASVPYVYASLSLRVQYDDRAHVYRANYTSFTITKVENSQVIYRSGRRLLHSSAQGKHFLQNQKPRRGVFVDGTYASSFLYDSLKGTRLSAFWGNKFLFAGAGLSAFSADYAEKYSASFEESSIVSFMALGGASVTVFRVRPYIEMGAGYYHTDVTLKDGSGEVSTPSGFYASFGCGADYFVMSHVTIGVFYATSYNYECGFTDNYGIRAGLNF